LTITQAMTISDRITRLLQELGITQAHFAGRSLGDLSGLVAQHPGLFATLTLVCPQRLVHLGINGVRVTTVRYPPTSRVQHNIL
jgi:pimeloyl-ACP methyl ester carboxylesterase